MIKNKVVFFIIIGIVLLNIMIVKTFADSEGNAVNDKFEVDIFYEYQPKTNTVVVHANSNRELIQKTLPGWILGVDKKSYTAEYEVNQTFNTNFTDTFGNKIAREIKINQIDQSGYPSIDINYEYKASNNTVVVHAKSNRKLIQKTLPGWRLSADKMLYTATYNANQTFNTNFTDIYGNKTSKKIVINKVDDKGPIVDVGYSYNESNNTVTVTVTSNEEMRQKTLPGWVLGEDKMSYTATYETNQTFNTNFTDIYGNKTSKEIVIKQIDERGKPSIRINCEYNKTTNTVVVYAKSDRKLRQKTLAGWVLGEDKMSYTATYKTNQTFTTNFTDIYGNKTSKEIVINQIDDKGPSVNIENSYNKSNNTVTVKVKSNEKMQQKTLPGWKLSEDEMSYTATYNKNQVFTTNFTDIYGNKTKKTIKISEIDDKGPDVKVTYSFNSSRTLCTVTVTSNEEMKQKTLAGWVLSEDKLSYTASYKTNQMFYTNFTDKWGNVTRKYIAVAFNKGIDVSQHNGKINWNEVKNSGIAFAIIRCGYGKDTTSQDDPYFQYNILECERLGIPYGVYLYSYALTENEAYSEAEHVLRLIRGHNPTIGVWIDMEDADGYKARHGMPSNATLVNICDNFCKTIQQRGYSAGVYANLSWLNTKLNSSKLEKYNTWVAQWNESCDYGKAYVMWQYTSSGSVPGILTRVDMNYYYR